MITVCGYYFATNFQGVVKLKIKYAGLSVLIVLLSSAPFVSSELIYKVQMDPLMTLFGYANLHVDRAVSDSISVGVEIWTINGDDPLNFSYQTESSIGMRVDWFDHGVFERGWHSNAMLKVDYADGDYARTRLKLTQTYQLIKADVFLNVGIGTQFLFEADTDDGGLYGVYQPWLVPSWEVSLGRAF